MMREIYVDGKRFAAMIEAAAHLYKRWGRRVSYTALRNAADGEGVLRAGKGKEVRVSWKAEAPMKERREEAPRVFRNREPLLRYPRGEGPWYDGSRGWK
jgi:hypothetical protein